MIEKVLSNLKSNKNPQLNLALIKFEKYLTNMLKNLKFTQYTNSFEGKMAETLSLLKSTPDFHILSDKTGNL